MSLPHIALIRTHHITSLKKVAKLRAAASQYNVYALLHYGGCPGIMYCQGSETGVKDWVATVQRLRYKEFQLVKRPAVKPVETKEFKIVNASFEMVNSVKEFGVKMKDLGVLSWWRRGMGYQVKDDNDDDDDIVK